MRDTVAIVGSHPVTRAQFDFTRSDCDVWVFNGACNDPSGWAKRADAVFQLHLPRNWRNADGRNGDNHYDWLQSGETPTIYMQEQYPDVPRAVKYPLEEVQAALLGNFNRNRYFTSSVAFALALAVYQGYKRIELYGVEMETNTEYMAQRDCVAFWVGVAVGRGIDVCSPVGIFAGERLYGYDGETNLDESEYRKRIDANKPALETIAGRYRQAHGEVQSMVSEWSGSIADGEKIVKAIIALSEIARRLGYADGVMQVAQHYLTRISEMKSVSSEYVINRQDYETQYYQHAKARVNANNEAVGVAAQMEATLEAAQTAKSKRARAKLIDKFLMQVSTFLHHCSAVGLYQAGEAENKNYMLLLDNMTAAAGATAPGG